MHTKERGIKMYRNILKRDLKRKKTMNLILFIFIILAATFIASSANNLVSISTALDSYFAKAEIPDYWIITVSQNANAFMNVQKRMDMTIKLWNFCR